MGKINTTRMKLNSHSRQLRFIKIKTNFVNLHLFLRLHKRGNECDWECDSFL